MIEKIWDAKRTTAFIAANPQLISYPVEPVNLIVEPVKLTVSQRRLERYRRYRKKLTGNNSSSHLSTLNEKATSQTRLERHA